MARQLDVHIIFKILMDEIMCNALENVKSKLTIPAARWFICFSSY
jgi:hypothetical protein